MLFQSCARWCLIYHLEQLSMSKRCSSHSFVGLYKRFEGPRHISLCPFGELLVMSLLQKITASCSVLCLLGNYLSMWNPSFWIYGCLVSLKAAVRWTLLSAFKNSKCTVGSWFHFSTWPVQGISVELWSLTSIYKAVCFFPKFVFFPKCYTCLCVTKLFLYSVSVYLFCIALENHWAY